jgi:hypothetical protein
MQDEDPELAVFQACLLETLHQQADAASILTALRNSEATQPFLDYINSFEPEMLELAALLVKKWGRTAIPSPRPTLHEMPH